MSIINDKLNRIFFFAEKMKTKTLKQKKIHIKFVCRKQKTDTSMNNNKTFEAHM